MTYWHYDRLTALDASFLGLEDHSVHMHVGSVGLFDAAPLAGPHGGLDMERVLLLVQIVPVVGQHPSAARRSARDSVPSRVVARRVSWYPAAA